MKKSNIILFTGVILILIIPKQIFADVCKTDCRTDEGVICLKRGPCESVNDLLLKAAKECREGGPARYSPITRIAFVDILSQVLRLDNDIPVDIGKLSDKERYGLEAKLLAQKGLGIFIGLNPGDPLTRDELISVLKEAKIEEGLGFSTGFADQSFDLNNEKFVVYDPKLYIDEGKGFELWERRNNFNQSAGDARHYIAKIDSCNSARIIFGNNINGRIPKVGARIKASYRILGREDEIVTECETVMLLSNPYISKSLRGAYNPSRPLTKANFADLLIRALHLEGKLPSNYSSISPEKLYLLESETLARKGINIFTGSNPNDLLSREELARILYDHPIVEVLGVSNGREGQRFELNNAGFIIYDLHTYVNEGARDEEWNKKDSFMESGSASKDYVLKMDSGNYATIYFGDNKRGIVPSVNSPIKASYRLYAPVDMTTEDDIMCVVSKIAPPVAEAYEPPPFPPDFPPPTDGFDDPATHI